MYILFVFLSFIGLAAGFLFLSEATMGVGIIGVGAILAMYARIAQAEKYQKQLLEKLDEKRGG